MRHLSVEVFPFTNTYPKSGASGKNTILSLRPYTDKQFCVCIDSDYDYLLSKDIQQGNDYIFQTYLYSIENYYSYASRLNDVVQKSAATVGNTPIDLEEIITTYSKLIYEGLLYSIYAEQMSDTLFERHEFAKIATSERFDYPKIETIFVKIKQKLLGHCKRLQTEYACNYIGLQADLAQKDIHQSNAYLFMRGHDLFNKPILQLVKQATDHLIKAEYTALKQINDNKERQTKMRDYKNAQKQVKEVLQEHNGFESNEFYQKIIQTIRIAFS